MFSSGELHEQKQLRCADLALTQTMHAYVAMCGRSMCQAEDVRPGRIQVDLGCTGLGLLLLWFIEFHQLSLSSGFMRLALVTAVLSSWCCLQDVSNLDAVVVSWRFKRTTTVPPASLPRGAQLYCEEEGFIA